ncbi:conserved Plasmodium protein, unknown function [Plasmodium berghei]|uniref:Uncharacterized protein n=1 Tax=Plasmodium berghei TaxID=5821 RepID=A0A122IPK2_PLABE|nr:conserved Plasmodium protein, unknown function [Plasmodium berghei]
MSLYKIPEEKLKTQEKILDKNILNGNIKKYDMHKLRFILRKYIRHNNRLLNYHKYKEVIDNFEAFKIVVIIYVNSFLNKKTIFNYSFRYSHIIKILYLNRKAKRLIYGNNYYTKDNTLSRNIKGRNCEKKNGLLFYNNKYAHGRKSSDDKKHMTIDFYYVLKSEDYDKLDEIICNSRIKLPAFSYFDIYLFSNNKKLKYEINKKKVKYIDVYSVLYYLYISVVISYMHLKDFHDAKIKFFEYIYLKRKIEKLDSYFQVKEKKKPKITGPISSRMKKKFYSYYDSILSERNTINLSLKNNKEETKEDDEINTKYKNKITHTNNDNNNSLNKYTKQNKGFSPNSKIKNNKKISSNKKANSESKLVESEQTNKNGNLKNVDVNEINETFYKRECDTSSDNEVIKNKNMFNKNEHAHFKSKYNNNSTQTRVTKKEKRIHKKSRKEYLTLDEYLLFLKIKHCEISLENLANIMKDNTLEDKICSIKKLRYIINSAECDDKTNLYKKDKILKKLLKTKDKNFKFYNYFFDVLIYFSYFKQIHIIEGMLIMALIFSKLNFINLSIYIYRNVYLFLYYIFENYQKKKIYFNKNQKANKITSLNITFIDSNEIHTERCDLITKEHIFREKNNINKTSKRKNLVINGPNEGMIGEKKIKNKKIKDDNLIIDSMRNTKNGDMYRTYTTNEDIIFENGNKIQDLNVNINGNKVNNRTEEYKKYNGSNKMYVDECSCNCETLKMHNNIISSFNNFLEEARNNNNFYFLNEYYEKKFHSSCHNDYFFLGNSLSSSNSNDINNIIYKSIIHNSIFFNCKYIFNGIKKYIYNFLNIINYIEIKYTFYQNNYNLKNIIYYLYMDKIIKSYDFNIYTYEKNMYVLKRIIFFHNHINVYHNDTDYLNDDKSIKSLFFKIFYNLSKNEILKFSQSNHLEYKKDIHYVYNNTPNDSNKTNHEIQNEDGYKITITTDKNLNGSLYIGKGDNNTKNVNRNDCDICFDKTDKGSFCENNNNISEKHDNHNLDTIKDGIVSKKAIHVDKYISSYYMKKFENTEDDKKENTYTYYINANNKKDNYFHKTEIKNNMYSGDNNILDINDQCYNSRSDNTLGEQIGHSNSSYKNINKLNSPIQVNAFSNYNYKNPLLWSVKDTRKIMVTNQSEENFVHNSYGNIFVNKNMSNMNNPSKTSVKYDGRKNDNFIDNILKKKKKINKLNKNGSDDMNNFKNQNVQTFFNFSNNELKIMVYNFLYLYILDEYIYGNTHKKDINEYLNFKNVLRKKQKLRYNFFNLISKTNNDIGNEIDLYKKYIKGTYIKKIKKTENKAYNSIFGQKTSIKVNVKKEINDNYKTQTGQHAEIDSEIKNHKSLLLKTDEEYINMFIKKKKKYTQNYYLLFNNKKFYSNKVINFLRDFYKKEHTIHQMKINIEKYEHIYFLFLITEALSYLILPYINSSFADIKCYKNMYGTTLTQIDKFRLNTIPLVFDASTIYQKGNVNSNRTYINNWIYRRKRLINNIKKGRGYSSISNIYNISSFFNNVKKVNFLSLKSQKKGKYIENNSEGPNIYDKNCEETKNNKQKYYRINTLNNIIKNESAYIQKYSMFNENETTQNTLFNKSNLKNQKKYISLKYNQDPNENIYYLNMYNIKETIQQIRDCESKLSIETKTVIENSFLFDDYYELDICELKKIYHNKSKYFLIKKYETIITLAFFTRYNTYLLFSLYQRLALLNYMYSNYNISISILRYINQIHCKLINKQKGPDYTRINHNKREYYINGNSKYDTDNECDMFTRNYEFYKTQNEGNRERNHFCKAEEKKKKSNILFYMKNEDIFFQDYIINTYSTNFINDKNNAHDYFPFNSNKTLYEKLSNIKSFRFSTFFDIFFELKINFNCLANSHICVQNALKYLFFFIKNAHKFNFFIYYKEKKRVKKRNNIYSPKWINAEKKYINDINDNNIRENNIHENSPYNESINLETSCKKIKERNMTTNSISMFNNNQYDFKENKTKLDSDYRGYSYMNDQEFEINKQLKTDQKIDRHNSCENINSTEHDTTAVPFSKNTMPTKYDKSSSKNNAYNESHYKYKIDINKLRGSKFFYIIAISLLKQINTNYYYDNIKEINLIYEEDLIDKEINVNNIVKNDYKELLHLSYKYIIKSIKTDRDNLPSYYYLCIIYLYSLKIEKCKYICNNFLLKNYHNAYSFPFWLLTIVVNSCRNIYCDDIFNRKLIKENEIQKINKNTFYKKNKTANRKNISNKSFKYDGYSKENNIKYVTNKNTHKDIDSSIFDNYKKKYISLLIDLKFNSPNFYKSITNTNDVFAINNKKENYMNNLCYISNIMGCANSLKNDCDKSKEIILSNSLHIPNKIDKKDDVKKYTIPEESQRFYDSIKKEQQFSKNIENINKRSQYNEKDQNKNYSSHELNMNFYGESTFNIDCFLYISKAINYFSDNIFFFYLYVHYMINFFGFHDIFFFWEKLKRNKKNNYINSKLDFSLLNKILEEDKMRSSNSSVYSEYEESASRNDTYRGSDVSITNYSFLNLKKSKTHQKDRKSVIINNDQNNDINYKINNLNSNNYEHCENSNISDRSYNLSGEEELSSDNFLMDTNISLPKNLMRSKNFENKLLTNNIKDEINKIQVSLKIIKGEKKHLRKNLQKKKRETSIGHNKSKRNDIEMKENNITNISNIEQKETKNSKIPTKGKDKEGEKPSNKSKQQISIGTLDTNINYMDSNYEKGENKTKEKDHKVEIEKKKKSKKNTPPKNKALYIDTSKVKLLPCSLPIILTLYNYIHRIVEKKKKNSDLHIYFYLSNIMFYINLKKIKCELHHDTNNDNNFVKRNRINNINCFFNYSKTNDKISNKYDFSENCKNNSYENVNTHNYSRIINNIKSAENIYIPHKNNNIMKRKFVKQINLKSIYLECITWINIGEILMYLKINTKVIIYIFNIIETYIKFYLNLNNNNNYYNYENTTFFYNLTQQFMCLKCLYLFYLYSKCKKKNVYKSSSIYPNILGVPSHKNIRHISSFRNSNSSNNKNDMNRNRMKLNDKVYCINKKNGNFPLKKKNLYTKIYLFEKEHELYKNKTKHLNNPNIVVSNNYIYFNDKIYGNVLKAPFYTNNKKKFRFNFGFFKKIKINNSTNENLYAASKSKNKENDKLCINKDNKMPNDSKNKINNKQGEMTILKKCKNTASSKKRMNKLYTREEMLFNSFKLESNTQNEQNKYRLVKNIKIYLSLINKIYCNNRKVNILYARYYFLKKKYSKVISILSLLNEHYSKISYFNKKKHMPAYKQNNPFIQNNFSSNDRNRNMKQEYLFYLNNQTDFTYEYLNIYMYYQSFYKLKEYKKSDYYKNVLNYIFLKCPIIPFNLFPFINL